MDRIFIPTVNRVSKEFVFSNRSVMKQKTMKSDIWSRLTNKDIDKDHRYIAGKLPGLFEVLYDRDGKRTAGGFRDVGKTKTWW